MRIRSAAASLFFLLVRGSAVACPACAGSVVKDGPSVWLVVGAFLLVPYLLCTAVFLALRRELKPEKAAGSFAARLARILPFRRAKTA